MLQHKYQLLILLSIISVCHCTKISSVQRAYNKGVTAYSDERWTECIKQFEESINLYKLYNSVIKNCRLKCNSQRFHTFITQDIENLQIYEKFFNKKECLNKCHLESHKNLQVDDKIEVDVVLKMQKRKPYEYLHLCYFHMNVLPKAASAAYTFLAVHPGDDNMTRNLNYYLQQPEVDRKEVVDLQSDDYVVLYQLGLKAYHLRNWADTVANMEQAITDYLHSENNCRVACEQQPEQEWSEEFTITMSNNFAALLHCQQQCQDKLKQLKYNSGPEFLADVLNHIQISYYHLNKIVDAAKSIATYLMLFPNDEDMLMNHEMYSTLVDAEAFIERSDIEYYHKRDTYEKKLLSLFHRGDHLDVDSNTI